jgi:hypothetical protein
MGCVCIHVRFEDNDINVGIQRRRDFVEYLLFRVHLQNGPELVYNSMRDAVQRYNLYATKELVIVKSGQLPGESI